MERNDFYLFLDFDGVLWDWKWRLNEIKQGRIKKGGIISEFAPQSVEALNSLLDYLCQNYDCNLVISSSWRAFFEHAKKTLIKNGVNLPKRIDRTPISSKNTYRSEEILSYLKSKDCPQNFLILDDAVDDVQNGFPIENIIRTNIYNGALNIEQINNWIDAHKNKFNLINDI